MTVVKSNVHEVDAILDFAKESGLEVRPTTYVFNTAENCAEERLSPEDAARAAAHIYFKTHSAREADNKRIQIKKLLDAGRGAHASQTQRGLCCHAGKDSYWVHSDGKFDFCGMAPMENEPNVFSVGLKRAWQIASENAANYVFPEKCASCQYRFICKKCYAMTETEGIPTACGFDTYTCRYYAAYAREFTEKEE